MSCFYVVGEEGGFHLSVPRGSWSHNSNMLITVTNCCWSPWTNRTPFLSGLKGDSDSVQSRMRWSNEVLTPQCIRAIIYLFLSHFDYLKQLWNVKNKNCTKTENLVCRLFHHRGLSWFLTLLPLFGLQVVTHYTNTNHSQNLNCYCQHLLPKLFQISQPHQRF